MASTRVILTVDTEPDVAGAMKNRKNYPPLIDEPIWGEVDGHSEALGFITRTLVKHDLEATFFLETAHVSYFGDRPMQQYTDHLMEAGQDIQLHIHPVWRNFNLPESTEQKYFDDCSELQEDELAGLINNGCDQIQKWTGRRPVAMRTGNFSASRSVYRAMRQAQLNLSSNICVATCHYPQTELQHPGGIQVHEGIHELPVSCFVDPGPIGQGRYRAVQITACSSSEMISMLKQCHKIGVNALIVVTHPFEFIKKTDFRYSSILPNRLVQRRFTRLCSFLNKHREHFQVSTFEKLSNELPLSPVDAPELNSSIFRSFSRATQNYLNDRI